MLVPLSWLRDFTPLEGDTKFLTDTFNELGLVVDGVQEIGGGLDGVVVARVLEVRAHPDADKVRLADVDLGDGQPLQIACGAANLAAGQLVPVATIGTVLPGDFEIARRKLRGEWSNGMICSADELGLASERASGIMVLPNDLTVGASFSEAMKIERDVVFDLDIEGNRPDAMCIAGIARDLAGKLKLPFSIPEPQINESDTLVEDLATLVVEDSVLCPRFTIRVITGVHIGPSPELIARRLTLAGMRPINNVVDASNYVMLELGQPSHPFDLDRVAKNTLRIRKTTGNESIETLDGSERALPADAGVVCDGDDKVTSVAGIMGGAISEIGPDTTSVLSEAAMWDPYAINKTSRQLALRTEASARFEKRIDREGILRAQSRIAEILLLSNPTAKIARGVIDHNATQTWPSNAERVRVRTARVNAVLGTDLTDEQVAQYIEPIGFVVNLIEPGVSEVLIPSFRSDSEREIDVIEEIARMYGYDNIARRVSTSPHVGGLSPYQHNRRAIEDLLTGLGLTEAWTSPLLSPGDLERAGLPEDAVMLTNPLLREESKLRTSFLPGLLKAVAFNLTRRNQGVRFFEVGRSFGLPSEGALLPDEREYLAVALANEDDDARSASRLWSAVIDGMKLRGTSLQPLTLDGLHPTRTAAIHGPDNQLIGHVGEVDPTVCGRFEINRRVGWLQLDLAAALALVEESPQMKPVSRYPAAEFDLAFIVDNAVSAAAVEDTLRASAGDILESVKLFDVFRGAQSNEGARSLAYALRVAALDHTLSESEVTDVRARAIAAVEATHGASLRS